MSEKRGHRTTEGDAAKRKPENLLYLLCEKLGVFADAPEE